MMELVIGGSGSGKSGYAEKRICELYRASETKQSGKLFYLAAMIPSDAETGERIKRHREQRRGRRFITREWYTGLKEKAQADPEISGSCALLECLSNLTANEMYAAGGRPEDPAAAVTEGVLYLKEKCRHLVVVTNDVFGEPLPDDPETVRYGKCLGEINRILAREADRVTEVTAGVPCSVAAGIKTAERKEGRGLILVTGGAFQGKRGYAAKLCPDRRWADGAVCPLEEIRSCRAVDRFHLFVRRWLETGKRKETLLREMKEISKDLILVSDEIGCGIVPVDPFERNYREAEGRIMTELAAEAEEVHRVVCGIGMRIR